MTMSQSKYSRQSNFEILRIICMISIIVLHIWTQTYAFSLKPEDGIPYFFFVFIGYGGRLVCNCFVMIGAWFLCDMEFKAERVVNLWLSVFSYAVSITLLCVALKLPDVTFVRFVQAFLPIMGRPVWFVAEYILLLMLSPFLNKIFIGRGMREGCRKLLIFFGVAIIVPATIFPIEYTKPAFSELLWFCFLYLFVAYVKKYPMSWMDKSRRCVGGALLAYGFCVTFYIVLECFGLKDFSIYYMSHYETLFSFTTSILLFMAFKNIDIGSSKIVNFLGESTFAVYVLHAMPSFVLTLWNGVFAINEHIDDPMYIIGVITVIFAVAAVVEGVRKILFKNYIYTRVGYKNICQKIDEFYMI